MFSSNTKTNRLRSLLFPPPFELPQRQAALLRELFPYLDWSAVRFFDGMPWFMRYSFAIATVLPLGWRSGLGVYVRHRAQDWDDYQTLTTLVHEAFHLQQYQDLNSHRAKWWQWAFLRPFLYHYLAHYFDGLAHYLWREKKSWSEASHWAYRYHPLEIPAYDFEAQFGQRYQEYLAAWDIKDFVKHNPKMIQGNSGLGGLAPASKLSRVLALFLLILIALAKPLLELPLRIFYVLIWAWGGLRKG